MKDMMGLNGGVLFNFCTFNTVKHETKDWMLHLFKLSFLDNIFQYNIMCQYFVFDVTSLSDISISFILTILHFMTLSFASTPLYSAVINCGFIQNGDANVGRLQCLMSYFTTATCSNAQANTKHFMSHTFVSWRSRESSEDERTLSHRPQSLFLVLFIRCFNYF